MTLIFDKKIILSKDLIVLVFKNQIGVNGRVYTVDEKYPNQTFVFYQFNITRFNVLNCCGR